jgi:hypothetical protein
MSIDQVTPMIDLRPVVIAVTRLLVDQLGGGGNSFEVSDFNDLAESNCRGSTAIQPTLNVLLSAFDQVAPSSIAALTSPTDATNTNTNDAKPTLEKIDNRIHEIARGPEICISYNGEIPLWQANAQGEPTRKQFTSSTRIKADPEAFAAAVAYLKGVLAPDPCRPERWPTPQSKCYQIDLSMVVMAWTDLLSWLRTEDFSNDGNSIKLEALLHCLQNLANAHGSFIATSSDNGSGTPPDSMSSISVNRVYPWEDDNDLWYAVTDGNVGVPDEFGNTRTDSSRLTFPFSGGLLIEDLEAAQRALNSWLRRPRARAAAPREPVGVVGTLLIEPELALGSTLANIISASTRKQFDLKSVRSSVLPVVEFVAASLKSGEPQFRAIPRWDIETNTASATASVSLNEHTRAEATQHFAGPNETAMLIHAALKAIKAAAQI